MPDEATDQGWRVDGGMLRGTLPAGAVRIRAAEGARSIDPAPPDSGWHPFCLWEWAEYLIEAPVDAVRLGNDATPVSRLSPDLHRFRFENAIGPSEVTFWDGDGRQIGGVPIEVLSPKLSLDPGSARYYPAFLRRLVDQTYEALDTLPFQTAAPTRLQAAMRATPAHDLFTLHFLLREARGLAEAVDAVMHAPYRVLTAFEEKIPAWRLRHVRPVAVRRAAAEPDSWSQVRGDARPVWTGPSGSFAPTALWTAVAAETLDNPENRFVLAFLRQLLQALRRLRPAVEASGSPSQVEAAHALNGTITDALRSPVWEPVGEMRVVPVQSHVMRHRAGYRELFTRYLPFLLGRAPFWGAIGEWIAQRNVASLYEAWCFLELVARLGRVLGPPRVDLGEPSGELGDTGLPLGRVEARFAGSPVTVAYNRRFSGLGVPERGRGYSVNLRPDVTVLVDGRPVGVFDAKFRFTWSRAQASAVADLEGLAKDEDIGKMHAYRDALGLRFAVVLYPGDVDCFYHRAGTSRDRFSLAQVVTDAAFEGVGVTSLLPGGRDDADLC